MRVSILGGGPAGLYFALLIKRDRPSWEVQVVERNAPDATFGWGVVFSAKTIRTLAEPDPPLAARLQPLLRTWQDVDIVHRGEKISVGGNTFSGISRIALLNALQERCREVGVELRFHREVEDLEGDLVVGADGVNSTLRRKHRRLFRPSVEEGRNRYIWYGTRQSFGGLTLIFREHEGGLYMAHAYRYSPELSTFIVEVDEATWARVRRLRDPQEHLQRVFADDLQGHPLLSNRSLWIRFRHVRNQRWWARNMVLLGDALHTAHFSIGSGTKLAMEDSIELWQTLLRDGSLADFEAARRPAVEEYQTVARRSQAWFETARERMGLSPLAFAYEAMTRSSRLDAETLERRDPGFVARYREASAPRSTFPR